VPVEDGVWVVDGVRVVDGVEIRDGAVALGLEGGFRRRKGMISPSSRGSRERVFGGGCFQKLNKPSSGVEIQWNFASN
jgi:hypothetical protein